MEFPGPPEDGIDLLKYFGHQAGQQSFQILQFATGKLGHFPHRWHEVCDKQQMFIPNILSFFTLAALYSHMASGGKIPQFSSRIYLGVMLTPEGMGNSGSASSIPTTGPPDSHDQFAGMIQEKSWYSNGP